MQRRAAAAYAAFFLVIGVVSYSLIATAEQPHVEVDNPEFALSEGDNFTVGEQQYTVSSVSAPSSDGGGGGGGGHGGGGGDSAPSATVAWTNQSSQYSVTWENNTSVTYEETNYTVVIPNATDPNQFTLREEVDEEAILQNDPRADNSTVTRNGTQYVVIDSGENVTLVPADEYFPEPSAQTFQEGGTIQYQGNQTTIQNVTVESATLAWTAPRENTVEVADGGNVTLGDTQFVAYFPDQSTLELVEDYEAYQQEVQDVDQFQEQRNGLWGIVILCGLVFLFLVGIAYLPSRY